MKRSIAVALAAMLQALLLTVAVHAATTVDPPHYDAASGFVCATCHTSHPDLGSTGYNNVCLSCHRPGDPAAGVRPLTLADPADPFGKYSASSRNISGKFQTSHRWDGSDTVPAAGAQPPLQMQMTTSNLRGRTLQELACVRCHNQHSNANGSFLRVANNRDQLCLDCHRSRNVQSHQQGSHPVGVNYNSVQGNFNRPPLNRNPANPTSDLNLQLAKSGGVVLCSSCHGVHFSDSRSSTADGSANFAGLSSGDGYLLRTDRRGEKVGAGLADKVNLCTNCHAGKRNHNLKGQDVQCDDCHGAHVEYDPNDPTGSKGNNIYLIKRALPKGASGSGVVMFRYTGSRREYKNDQGTGVCQGCHAVPAPGGVYPNEHAGSDPRSCNTCHYHNNSNGSFSGACNACHGYPPTAAVLGGPDGLALPATGATPANPGAHAAHAKTRFMACNTCHSGYSAKAMPSSSIDIGFAINGSNFPGFAGSANGGTFNATPLNNGYSWSASNGTILTTANAAVSCNVYCHGSTLSGGSNTSPAWLAGPGQAACGACHGVTAATALSSGGHLRHAGNGAGGLGLACAVCHGTISDNSHMNGSVGWDLSGLGGGAQYKSAAVGSTGAAAPSASYGQCSNIYCHSRGTSFVANFIPNISPLWGGASPGCGGCHDGTATGPAYANGLPKANSHNRHVVLNGYTCDYCHADVTTTGTSITTPANHANRQYNLLAKGSGITFVATVGTPLTPSSCANISCHGGNGATWGAALGCENCHLGGSDVDVFTAPFTPVSAIAVVNSSEWSSTGHGRTVGSYASANPAAAFSGSGQCLYCHDAAVGHNQVGNAFRLLNSTDPVWGRNGVCMSCHAAGSAGVTVGGISRNGSRKVGSYHYGTSHSITANGGRFCWDCHDGHGDGNIYMIHDNVYSSSDPASGVPTGTAAPVSFTAAVSGTNYAKSAAPFDGICNVCHTNTGHYSKSGGDGHNSGTRCTTCHNHNGPDALSAFAPSGSSCDACHGYPPAAAGFAGTQNNWSSARIEDYPGGGGAHTINNHVSRSAKPADGFAQCSKCHRAADHRMSPTVFKPSQNIKVNVNQEVRYVPSKQAGYTSNRLDGLLHKSGTCSNISCHFGASPMWNQR